MLTVPGTYFHCFARGDNKELLFRDADDFESYLRHMDELEAALPFRRCFCCLMDNHLHLLLFGEMEVLPRVFERQHGWYARRVNAKHGRVGHVFEKPYGYRMVLDDRYLLQVIRYILMNPVAAGLVLRPEQYPWSDMLQLLQGAHRSWELLAPYFPGADGLRRFYDFVVAGPVVPTGDNGWPDEPWYQELPTLLPEPRLAESLGVDVILGQVAAEFGLSADALRAPAKTARLGLARATAMTALRRFTPLSLRDIAGVFGLKSPQVVGNRLAWMRDQSDPRARAVLERLRLS